MHNKSWKTSGISRKYPSYRDRLIVTNQSWLKSKQVDDEAESLWRIHNTLYDFTKFINQHPGGSFWLEKTKGTDITEMFEAHHIRNVSSILLDKYKIREASKPRNYTWTFHENGFYKTLKRRVALEIGNLDVGPKKTTDILHCSLLATTFIFLILSTLKQNILFEFIAALALCWLSIAAHNYFHRKDNWQMYTFNLTLMNFAEWRISHVLSHHIYTNSLNDLEMSLQEPFLCWIPNAHIASKLRRYISVVIQPVVWILIFPYQLIARSIQSISGKNELYWHDAIGFIIPIMMLVVNTNATVLQVMLQWSRIIAISSFLFGLIGLNAAHHTPEIHHDGDADRIDRDWGLYQLDTAIDRGDIKGSHFMVLTHFGEHILHHLFPTLDHGILPQLYPILLNTLKEFEEELREKSFLEHLIGQNKQLMRTKANPVRPGQKKKSTKLN